MSIDFKRLLAMLFVIKPCAVVLSICIGVGGCLCPISLSAWRAGMALRQLMKSALSLASAAEDYCYTVKYHVYIQYHTVTLTRGNNSKPSGMTQ